mgnify:CR=1 FL=1
MPRFFVKNNQINNDKITIIDEDVKHIKNVLRKAVGDEIIICDNKLYKTFYISKYIFYWIYNIYVPLYSLFYNKIYHYKLNVNQNYNIFVSLC